MGWSGTRRLRARNKYGAKKTVADGLTFASQKEARRWMELRLLERAKKICQLEPHPEFSIVVGGIEICTYVADFRYQLVKGRCEDWPVVVEDVKSGPTKTPLYRLKKKLVKALYGIDIQEV